MCVNTHNSLTTLPTLQLQYNRTHISAISTKCLHFSVIIQAIFYVFINKKTSIHQNYPEPLNLQENLSQRAPRTYKRRQSANKAENRAHTGEVRTVPADGPSEVEAREDQGVISTITPCTHTRHPERRNTYIAHKCTVKEKNREEKRKRQQRRRLSHHHVWIYTHTHTYVHLIEKEREERDEESIHAVEEEEVEVKPPQDGRELQALDRQVLTHCVRCQ